MRIRNRSPFSLGASAVTMIFALLAVALTPFANAAAQTARFAGASPAACYKIQNAPTRLRGVVAEACHFAEIGALGQVSARVFRADGTVEDLGVLSRRVVTNNGVGFIVDAFQNLTELEAMQYHDCGTGGTAEAAGDAALVTPSGVARVAGAATEPGTNQYRSTATISFVSTLAIVEHGLFSASTSGVLFDRSVFSAINVASGDSIQFQYTVTLTAGG